MKVLIDVFKEAFYQLIESIGVVILFSVFFAIIGM